jgi:thioredoxin reductase (NADPH)
LPLGFTLKFRTTSKEKLLGVRNEISRKTGLKGTSVNDDAFEVRTTGSSYMAASVLLAIGRRGTPRKLEVEGEEQPKMVHRMIGRAQYGAGTDSWSAATGGLEAATSMRSSKAPRSPYLTAAKPSRARTKNRA